MMSSEHSAARPSAVVIAQNAAWARPLTRVLDCAGFEVCHVPDAAALPEAPPVALFADLGQFDALRQRGRSLGEHIFLWHDEPAVDALRLGVDHPNVRGFFGLRYPGAMPRHWEMLGVARRIIEGIAAPPRAPLVWGHDWHEHQPTTTGDRDRIVGQLEAFARTQAGERRAAELAEVAHELLMNAMYDAPVDAAGSPLFAGDRTQKLTLELGQRPTFGYGSDGMKLVIAVSDPFGGLSQKRLFEWLHNALTEKKVNPRGGGAGLGLSLIYRACSVLLFDVVPGRLTRVVAVAELDVPTRELRNLPRSIHYFRLSKP